MRKRLSVLALMVSLAGFAMLGCGGGSSSTSIQQLVGPQGSASLVLLGRDAPLCDVLSFKVTITGATLIPQQMGVQSVSIISSSSPVTVDFAGLREFSTVLTIASVPPGTFSKITLMLSNPQLVVLDGSPPAPRTITNSNLTTSTVTIDLNPVLHVTANSAVGFELDFNLPKSVETNANGQVTGTVNPVFQASPTTLSIENGLAELEDLEGMVQNVKTTGTDPFIGSFDLQMPRGQTFTINVTSATRFEDGITKLSDLVGKTNTFVEVDAFVDANGKIVAKEVEVEEQEDLNQNKAAFVGLVTSVTRPATPGKSATQFTLFVREEEPDASASIPLNSTLTVNVSPTTQFRIDGEGNNRAGLRFDATTLGQGQSVTVHGQFQPANLNATRVVLRLQTIEGKFSTGRVVGGDGKTGGFVLTPCSVLFKGQTITVLTFNQTGFQGVADLNGLTTSPTLLVKGLLFFEQGLVSVSGVNNATGLVLVAKQVHQLP